MNQIIIKLNDFSDDEQRITSKEIAELTGLSEKEIAALGLS
jgi:Fe-S-cluster formation regulator IscX/YfhJ